MAWPNPRKTWSQSELVTPEMMNEHVRDALNALESRGVAIQIGTTGAGAIGTGVKLYLEIPFSCTIVGWTLLADQVGSIVVDVWRDTYGNFPPTVVDTIAGSEKPTLSAEQKAQDLNLTTWDVDVDAGDVLGFNVDSATDVESVTLTLRMIPR